MPKRAMDLNTSLKGHFFKCPFLYTKKQINDKIKKELKPRRKYDEKTISY